MPVEIFCCYARKDQQLLQQLMAHLMPLQRQGRIIIWSDTNINAGKEWDLEITKHLNTSQIILLLVSPDFMMSEYIYSKELKRAIERHEQGDATVIPIILRWVSWQRTPLGKLQALPKDGKPVKSWQDEDEAFYNVIEGIYKVVEELMSTPFPPSSPAPAIEPSKPEPTDIPAHVQQQQTSKPEPLVPPEDFTWQCIRTLTGHKNSVSSVAISPDGQTLASGSADSTIKLWNLKTGALLHTLTGHKYSVVSVAISPDGLTLASGSYDKTIKLWNLKTGALLHTLTGHEDHVSSVAISPDGLTLASGSYDKTIKLWNLKTGALLRTLTGNESFVRSVAISPDGLTLASGSVDSTIKLWNLKTGDLLRTLTGHESSVVSVAISPDGLTLASGSSAISSSSFLFKSISPDGLTLGSVDSTIKLWNLKTGDLLRTLTGHEEAVVSVAISPDGQTLASGSEDKTIKLWNLKTGDLLRTLTGHENYVYSVAISPDGQTLASGSADNTIKLWEKK